MTEAAFAAALSTNPADWATRLVYADWLFDQGRDDDSATQRWMVENCKAPHLLGCYWDFWWQNDRVPESARRPEETGDDMTEQAFNEALDARPDDWTTRAVYADWLLDQSRDDEAACQRWMARNRKSPRLGGQSWDWWWNAELFPDDSSRLVSEMFNLLPINCSNSRKDLEESLQFALKKLEMI